MKTEEFMIYVKVVSGVSKKTGKEYLALVDVNSGKYLAFGVNDICAILDLKPSEVRKLSGKEK